MLFTIQGFWIVLAFIAFARNAKSFAVAIISSFSFSLQQIWTDWPKFRVNFSTFVKLDECGLIQTHWRNVMWEMFISIWNFVCENMAYHEKSSWWIKKSEGKGKVFNTRIWLIDNMKVILYCYLRTCLIVRNQKVLADIVVNNGWSIHQPFLKKLSNNLKLFEK